jgi:hypothetical protein
MDDRMRNLFAEVRRQCENDQNRQTIPIDDPCRIIARDWETADLIKFELRRDAIGCRIAKAPFGSGPGPYGERYGEYVIETELVSAVLFRLRFPNSVRAAE